MSTKLEGSWDNFSGPTLGPLRQNLRRPMALYKPFEAFWPNMTFIEICSQTNMYAKQKAMKLMKGGLNGGTK